MSVKQDIRVRKLSIILSGALLFRNRTFTSLKATRDLQVVGDTSIFNLVRTFRWSELIKVGRTTDIVFGVDFVLIGYLMVVYQLRNYLALIFGDMMPRICYLIT